MTREERARAMLAKVLAGYQFSESDKQGIALAMALFAEEEASAMLDRAAYIAANWCLSKEADGVRDAGFQSARIATHIRALPATGEVGRG